MARIIITAFNSRSFVGDEELDQHILGFGEWINTRETTIRMLENLAGELDKLHKKLAAFKLIIGGAIGGVGGVIATVAAFATEGLDLYVGLGIGSGGNLAAAILEIHEHVKNKTDIKEAQKTIDDDKATLNSLLSKLLLGYKLEQTSDVRIDGSSFVDKRLQNGSTMWGWTSKAISVYSLVKDFLACTSIGELDGVEQLMIAAKFAGPAMIALDLFYLVYQIMDIYKDNLSDGARAIHEACKKLEQEKEDICQIKNALEAEKNTRDN